MLYDEVVVERRRRDDLRDALTCTAVTVRIGESFKRSAECRIDYSPNRIEYLASTAVDRDDIARTRASALSEPDVDDRQLERGSLDDP